MTSTVGATHKFRFTASGSVTNSVISYQQLSQLYGVAYSATDCYQLIDSVKICSLELWGPVPAAGATTVIACEWSNTNTAIGSDTITYLDSSVSPFKCPHIRMSPSNNSSQAMWHNGADTSNAVKFTVPTGTVIDFTLAIKFIEDTTTLTYTAAAAGLTAGRVYWSRLDGSGGSLPATVPNGYVA